MLGFDQYSLGEIGGGKWYEVYGKAVSIVVWLLFVVHLVVNKGYLMYPIIDFYQLLFLLVFLGTDFPPMLNFFLYGFGYSHLLFLPQIFNRGLSVDTTFKTPLKLGIVVPGTDFLGSTGHDFLIIFVAVGLFAAVKVGDFVMWGIDGDGIKSNKVGN
jgi:hypothetical protein